ncbi:MAG TPA: TIGR03000 domain-containing protein [Gemmataceae bacterium]|nr:TIGR03000 domain-containing protein [Gemmataceae bacterium]
MMRRLVAAFVVAAALVLVSAENASARGCHHGGGCCYSGCYSGCYSCGYSYCYTCYAPCYYYAPPTTKPTKPGKEEGYNYGSTATIVVNLPADAKLTVDGQATTSTSDTRTFVTPALESGKDFAYSFNVEVVRNGVTLTAKRDVVVRAGEATRVTLEPTATTAANAN